MTTTIPPFNWPVPSDTDLLANGAAAMRALATAISATVDAGGGGGGDGPPVAGGNVAIQPDGLGNFTWNHGLPFTPVGLSFTPIVSPTFLNPPIVMIRSDGLPNATRVLLRIVLVTGAPMTSSFSARFVATGTAGAARVPTDSWSKAEIVDWLVEHGVSLTEEAMSHLSKAELLALVADLMDAER